MFEPSRRKALHQLALAGTAAMVWPLAAQAETGNLEQIKARGILTVAVYDDLPPFSSKGAGGIDMQLAEAIAAELGVKASFLPFPDGEEVGDDLRNMVWKGHYMGYGPADLMMHVPVDRPLIEANPQVRIFAPYYRERTMMARDLKALPDLPDLAALKNNKVGVCGASLPGILLIGADGGAHQSKLSTTFQDGVAAAKALLRGEVQAAAGLQSELESVLGGDPRYAIEAIPVPRPPIDGWTIGCAVRKNAGPLAEAIQAAMNKLTESGRVREVFKQSKVNWRAV